jgi:hypothetical protein
MHLDDLLGDGKAQPRAALGLGNRVVDLVELLEDLLLLLRPVATRTVSITSPSAYSVRFSLNWPASILEIAPRPSKLVMSHNSPEGHDTNPPHERVSVITTPLGDSRNCSLSLNVQQLRSAEEVKNRGCRARGKLIFHDPFVERLAL